MKEVITNSFICIGISCIAVYFSVLIESQYIFVLLDRGLIIILISLLAINTTTSSVILTKLKEIADRTGGSFSNTIQQLHLSIKEQVWLIILGLFFLILNDSSLLKSSYPSLQYAVSAILVAIFVYAVLILRDTANAIFVILNYEKD